MKDNGTDSFYSFMDSGYEAPVTEKAPKSETPHANRQDLRKPYSHARESDAHGEQSVSLTPKHSAECEWWRFYTGQQTDCEIAREFNRKFSKPIADYAAEKRKYITGFKELA